jgi:hypothetical protein
MQQLIPTVKKAIVGVVAVGALSVGVAGAAGAATPTPATPASTRLARFNCANATSVLDRIQKGEADIAAGLPKLTAAQAKAAAAGHTKVADKLQKRITRLESAGFKARLDKATSAIEAKCHVGSGGSPAAG